MIRLVKLDKHTYINAGEGVITSVTSDGAGARIHFVSGKNIVVYRPIDDVAAELDPEGHRW